MYFLPFPEYETEEIVIYSWWKTFVSKCQRKHIIDSKQFKVNDKIQGKREQSTQMLPEQKS